MCMHVYTHVYIYIYRERERYIHTSVYIYVYTHMYVYIYIYIEREREGENMSVEKKGTVEVCRTLFAVEDMFVEHVRGKNGYSRKFVELCLSWKTCL